MLKKRLSIRSVLICSALLLSPAVAFAECYNQAGMRYGIHPDLLRSIAFVESSWNNQAVNKNSNGTEDVCLMQVNSFWWDKLARYGVSRSSLLNDSCLCVQTGAYILASEIAASGNSWVAIGRYHTGPNGSEGRKLAYANKVKRVFDHLQSKAIR